MIVKISEIKANPNNPRLVKDDKFAKLVESVKGFPDMLNVRPIVVNKDMIVLGGNMRLKAMKEAGYKEAKIELVDWTEEQQREFIIKDNLGYGEWDWNMIANEWDIDQINEWGLDIPIFKESEELEEKMVEDLAWLLSIRCDGEKQAQQLYERFINEGLDVKIVN